MVKKNILIIFTGMLALLTAPANTRSAIGFKVTPDATVADLLCSTHKKHTGLNLPRCPEYSPRYFWQTTPAKMAHYSAYFKLSFGTLPTATFIRFLAKTPELIEDTAIRKVYSVSLAEFIKATKATRAKPTKSNIALLRAKEAVVLSFLKRLDLQNPLIRAKTARLLSTPKEALVLRILNSYILPWRSTFKDLKCKKGKKLRITPTFGLLPLLSTTVIGSGLAFGARWLFDSDTPAWLIGAFTLYKTFKAFNNDTKLTPEPYKGIKVKIQLDECTDNDESASQTGYTPDF